MLKDENVYETLAQEIRSAFDSPEKINDYSCRDLAYLNAVCKEAMRIYAPLPIATPREVPEGGDTVDGHFIPSGVRILPIYHCLSVRRSARPLKLTRLDTDRGCDQPRRSELRPSKLRRTSCFQAGTLVGRVRWLR